MATDKTKYFLTTVIARKEGFTCKITHRIPEGARKGNEHGVILKGRHILKTWWSTAVTAPSTQKDADRQIAHFLQYEACEEEYASVTGGIYVGR